jgi:hypothetical protein
MTLSGIDHGICDTNVTKQREVRHFMKLSKVNYDNFRHLEKGDKNGL